MINLGILHQALPPESVGHHQRQVCEEVDHGFNIHMTDLGIARSASRAVGAWAYKCRAVALEIRELC